MTMRRRIQQALRVVILVCSAVAFLLWLPSFYDLFWWRRCFLFGAGGLALLYLFAFQRTVLKQFATHRLLTATITVTITSLLFRSPLADGLIGRPLFHPATLSLLSAVCLGIFFYALPRKAVLVGYFIASLWWASVCLLFWLSDQPRDRLGFIDSQVIYAAYLFMVAIIVGQYCRTKNYLSYRAVLFGSGLLLLCLLLTQTRSALAIAILYLLWSNRTFIKRHLTQFGIAAAIGLLVILGSGSLSRLSDTKYLGESVSYRWHLVQASLPDNASDLLLGSGVGSIERNITANATDYPDISKSTNEEMVRFESSHNYLIDVVVERGLIASGLLTVLIARLLWVRPREQSLAWVLLASTSTYLLVNNINLQMELMLWTFILWRIGETAKIKPARSL